MDMKRRSFFAFTTIASLGAVTLASCTASGGKAGTGGGGPEASKQAADLAALKKVESINPKDTSELDDGGTISVPAGDPGGNFNPFCNSGNSVDNAVLVGLYAAASVYKYEYDGTAVLNKDYALDVKDEIKDGKQTVTYTLNPKAKWNDGTPITWEDLKQTWKNLNGENKDFAIVSEKPWDAIESIEKGKDEYEAVMKMKKVYEPVSDFFTYSSGSKMGSGIMNRKVNTAAIFNEGFVNEPHAEWGCGPFKLEKWDQTGKTFTFARNENWWGDKPVLEKIIYRVMEDDATMAAYLNQQVDLVGASTLSRYQQAQAAPNNEFRRNQGTTLIGYFINTRKAPYTDPKVCEAIGLATDRKALIDLQYKGLNWDGAVPGSWNLLPFVKGYQDNNKAAFDLAAAKAALESSGWKLGASGIYEKDGKPLNIKVSNFTQDPTRLAVLQLWQKQLKEAGMALEIVARPGSEFGKDLAKFNYEITFSGYGMNSDPTSSLFQLFGSTSESNLPGYKSPEVDKLIEKAISTADYDARMKVVNEIETLYNKSFAQAPIFNGPAIVAINKNIANYGPGGFRFLDWAKVGWVKGTKKG